MLQNIWSKKRWGSIVCLDPHEWLCLSPLQAQNWGQKTHIHESLKVLMSHTFGPFVHRWRICSSAHAAWWSVAQPLSNWPFHFHSKHKNCSEISPGILTLPGWLHTPSRELVSFKSSMHCTQNWRIFPDRAHAGETEKSLQILHPPHKLTHLLISSTHITCPPILKDIRIHNSFLFCSLVYHARKIDKSPQI